MRGSLGAVCVMMQCYVMYSLLSYDLKYYVMGWDGVLWYGVACYDTCRFVANLLAVMQLHWNSGQIRLE